MLNEKDKKKEIKIMKQKLKMEHLKSVLKPCRIDKKNGSNKLIPATHTTMRCKEYDIFEGSYYIDKDHIKNFEVAYCNAVNKGCSPTVTENPEMYGPLRVDIDLEAPLTVGDKRQYDEDHLKKIVGFYQDEIKNIVSEEVFENSMLTCIVLEKLAPRVEETIIKDGFHLHFPNFICVGYLMDYYLRPRVLDKIKSEAIWDDCKYSNPIDRRIDNNMGKKLWLMYGSRNYKNSLSTPYIYNRKCGTVNDPWKNVKMKEQYGHVFDHNLEVISMEDVFASKMEGKKQESVKFYLPLLLSIRGYESATLLKKKITDTIKYHGNAPDDRIRRKPLVCNKHRPESDIMTDITTIRDGNIMDMISAERAYHYDSWMDVGWTLFNITCGREEGLDLWIEFSKRGGEKFVPGKCEELWQKMEYRGKTISCLFKMAEKDSKLKFIKWESRQIDHAIKDAMREKDPKEHDITKIVNLCTNGHFRCAIAERNEWYYFRDHRWRKCDDATDLKKVIMTDVSDRIRAYSMGKGEERKDDEDQAKLWKIITKLKDISFVEKIVRVCKIFMHDPLFMKKKDKNKKLLCCENGVIDLELGIFREGRPDDYCTLSTGITFEDFDPQDDEVLFVDEYLRKVFTNENVRNYFLDALTSCLEGGNKSKHIYLAVGPTGDNSKTVLMKIIKRMFGEYCGKFPRQVFMKGCHSSANSHHAELLQAADKRIMMVSELTHQDNFDIGVLKYLSGNDEEWVRGAFEKNGIEMSFDFCIWMQMNKPPKMPQGDEPTWGRMRVIEFLSKFVRPDFLKKYPVPENEDDQYKIARFKADPSFADNLPYMAPVLLWKCFNHHRMFKEKHGKQFALVHEPKEVLAATRQYKEENDPYAQFISERLKKVKDESDEDKIMKTFIRNDELYRTFVSWFRLTYPTHAKSGLLPDGPIAKTEFVARLGQQNLDDKEFFGLGKQNRWHGWEFNYDDYKHDDKQDGKHVKG